MALFISASMISVPKKRALIFSFNLFKWIILKTFFYHSLNFIKLYKLNKIYGKWGSQQWDYTLLHCGAIASPNSFLNSIPGPSRTRFSWYAARSSPGTHWVETCPALIFHAADVTHLISFQPCSLSSSFSRRFQLGDRFLILASFRKILTGLRRYTHRNSVPTLYLPRFSFSKIKLFKWTILSSVVWRFNYKNLVVPRASLTGR